MGEICGGIEMTQENIVENWKNAKPGTLKLDWQEAEEAIGFKLHENFKDFYSRTLSDEGERDSLDTVKVFQMGKWVEAGQPYAISGIMKWSKELVKEQQNGMEGWLDEADGGRDFCEFSLRLLSGSGSRYVSQFVKEAFCGDWTGGNDFGHRAYIGEMLLNTGEISLIFNNDTGRFEWVDFGYGYFEVYEENPYGIIAETAQELLDKITVVEYG